LQTPGFLRRLGGVLYEALAVIALWMLASAGITTIFDNATQGPVRWMLQGVSLLTISGYFLWCWTHGGQTLAMKTWRVKVVTDHGALLSFPQALQRLLLATVLLVAAGIGFWWALVDRDGQFLHDRLGKTRLVLLEKQP
jgi:uncharacterized RDD family membrane protein YckC